MRKREFEISDLPSDFYDKIVSMFKEDGMSIKEVCSEFGITPSIHARLKKENEEYAKAFDDGVTFSEAWWMKQGRQNLTNKSFNVGVYAFNMKNRFKWRDTPLVVGGTERKLADQFKEKELVERYKKTEDVGDETVIN
jgi:hypothetical protein